MKKENINRISLGKHCSVLGIILNLVLFAIKLTASIMSKSLSAIADAFNNLTDASASIVSFIGFRFSSAHGDKEHPYGHARAEYLSALVVAMIILIIGFEFIKSAVKAIISPYEITLSPAVFIIMIISVIIKIIMAIYNYRIGKSIDSSVLIATSIDARNDAIMTTGVIIGYVISYYTKFYLDGYISLVLALFIFISGLSLVKSTIDPLLGQAPDKELVEHIRKKILSYPDILGAHDLIVHDYGPEKRFASVHVEMAAEKDIIKSHDIIDHIEQSFLINDNINMIIHLDPIITDDKKISALRLSVMRIAKNIHPDCTIHDLRAEGNEISFDCLKPSDCQLSDEALVASFDVALRLINPQYTTHITIDSSFSPIIK